MTAALQHWHPTQEQHRLSARNPPAGCIVIPRCRTNALHSRRHLSHSQHSMTDSQHSRHSISSQSQSRQRNRTSERYKNREQGLRQHSIRSRQGSRRIIRTSHIYTLCAAQTAATATQQRQHHSSCFRQQRCEHHAPASRPAAAIAPEATQEPRDEPYPAASTCHWETFGTKHAVSRLCGRDPREAHL